MRNDVNILFINPLIYVSPFLKHMVFTTFSGGLVCTSWCCMMSNELYLSFLCVHLKKSANKLLPVASKRFLLDETPLPCLAYTIKRGLALEPFTVLDREPGTCCLTSLHTESIAPVWANKSFCLPRRNLRTNCPLAWLQEPCFRPNFILLWIT